MAKRTSEHQITRDDGSEDEDHEVRVGMSKADSNVLATRQIKGLPKRKGATPLATSVGSSNSSSADPSPRMATFTGFGASAATPAETKPEAPRFSGFTGFGSAPAAAPDSAAKPAETPRFAGFMGFGAAPKKDAPPPSTETKPTFTGFGTSKSGTAAPFALTSSPFGSVSAPKPEPPKPESKETTSAGTDAALKYWTSLRGLNHAFVENLKKSFEGDMFSDLTESVKQYQEFREKIIKEYEDSKKSAEKKSTETKSTFSFGTSSSTFSTSSPFTFGAPKPPAESKPTLTMPPNPTIFGSKDAPLVTPAATPPVIPPSPKKPLPAYNSTEAPAPEATPTPSPMPEGSTPNVFEVAAKKSVEEKNLDKPVSPSKPTFTFGSGASTGFGATSNPFGSSATPTPFGSSTATKPEAKPFSFSTSNGTAFSGFGGASTTTSADAASTTITPGASTPSKAFTFTTPLSTPGTPFAFGAGSPKGNTTTAKPGGSVGFSFGASPPRKEPASFPFGAVSGPTSAAATPKSETGPPTSDEDKDKDKSNEGESAETKADEEPDADKAQTSGAGEENEDTVFGARARVLRFYNQAWVGVGIGQFKIKYDRETKKRRILHRLEGTGRVVVNCGLFDEMNPVLESKGLMRFTALDDQGHPMLYRVKVKTEAEAESLTSSLKDAIDASKTDKA
ncbi:unnamed protein product [Rhizoctonia solani]|uniref:RanBD1 domain-containing protein n=1 Tax=Rhizoctonia solani TaxID=456999 RepID=A0A8H3ABP1_9AGAM|nr:unnamed protein product [Rhizoctonia solani]